jgi:AcrR family transcriptional regulator
MSKSVKKDKAMDRRIRKTQEAILDAFVALMLEKDFEQITINEIADRADVNRGTVYLHYVDKYDLLDQCIDMHLNQLFESCLPIGNCMDISYKTSLLRMFEYLEQNVSFYSMMLTDRSIPTFGNRLQAMVLQSVEKQIDGSDNNSGINKEILLQFLSSAVVGLLEWWITHSMPYSAAEMVEQVWLLVENIQLMPNPLNE